MTEPTREELYLALTALEPIMVSAESNASGNPDFEFVRARLAPAWRLIPHAYLAHCGPCQRCGNGRKHELHRGRRGETPAEGGAS